MVRATLLDFQETVTADFVAEFGVFRDAGAVDMGTVQKRGLHVDLFAWTQRACYVAK